MTKPKFKRNEKVTYAGLDAVVLRSRRRKGKRLYCLDVPGLFPARGRAHVWAEAKTLTAKP